VVIARRILLAGLLFALLPVPLPSAGAQGQAEIDRYFRVEYGPQAFSRRGPSLEGYVYSTHNFRVGGMRLRIQVLDDQGRVVKEGFGFVPGDIPSGGRAYFTLPVPEKGSDYRISVASYYLVSRDAP